MIVGSMKNDDTFVDMTSMERRLLSYICHDLCPEYPVGDEEQYSEAIATVKRRKDPVGVDRAIDATRIILGCAPTADAGEIIGDVTRRIDRTGDEIISLTKRIHALTLDVRSLSLIKEAIVAQFPDILDKDGKLN